MTSTKENKTAALGVAADLLCTRGVRSPADIAIAITGVTGPDKDEDGNPVGLVCIAVARESLPPSVLERHYGDIGGDVVRERAMIDALREVERLLLGR